MAPEKQPDNTPRNDSQSENPYKLKSKIPVFKDLYAKRRWVLEHTAIMFRVFARNGFTEGETGHMTVRDPIDRETFWINPLGRHFSLIKVSDMVHVDKFGDVIGENKSSVNRNGLRVHLQIHQAKPEIDAICHAHSIYGKAYSSFGALLEPLNQDACVFTNNHFVYTGFSGTQPDTYEGSVISKDLGDNQAVILRNHGLMTFGSTIDEAAYLFSLMEKSCQIQLSADAASACGKPKHVISDENANYVKRLLASPEALYAACQPEIEAFLLPAGNVLS